MKYLFLSLFCLPLLLFSQEAKKPGLMDVINIKVKAGQEDAFEAAVKKHDEKFHPQGGPYAAHLTYNINGPLAGMYTWIMGPTTWTAMDEWKGEGAHDDDWDVIEKQYIESYDGPYYWERSPELSHIVEGAAYSKRLIWMYDIKQGQGARWSELVEKVRQVYEEVRKDETMYVVWNQFSDTDKGMDAAIIWGFDKWSWMDDDSDFSADYENVHGKGSWHNFLNEFSETVDGRVDWIREVVD